MQYGFEEGTVGKRGDRILLRKSGLVVRPPVHLNTGSLPGQEVYVSWLTRNGKPRRWRGKLYVEREAIEPENMWLRPSRFRPKFPRGLQDGFLAEELSLQLFRRSGVRAETATRYEDERLGVDIWIFLKGDGEWRWYPIDITLRNDMDPYSNGSKYDKDFRAGVLPLHVAMSELENLQSRPSAFLQQAMQQINAAVVDFQVCGKPLLQRGQAMEEEVREFGPWQPQI